MQWGNHSSRRKNYEFFSRKSISSGAVRLRSWLESDWPPHNQVQYVCIYIVSLRMLWPQLVKYSFTEDGLFGQLAELNRGSSFTVCAWICVRVTRLTRILPTYTWYFVQSSVGTCTAKVHKAVIMGEQTKNYVTVTRNLPTPNENVKNKYLNP